MRRYQQLVDIIAEIKPRTIIEVGTNSGTRAELMIREASKHHSRVFYWGYDLFELATPDTDKAEMNGKTPAVGGIVKDRLEKTGAEINVFPGNTRDTLHGKVAMADFAFVDGGHSVETIRGDYEALKNSRCIILDDYYTSGVDTTKWGCNSLVADIPHRVLPIEDRFGSVGVKMVRIDRAQEGDTPKLSV